MLRTIDSSRQLALWLLKRMSEKGVMLTLDGDAQLGLTEIFSGRAHDYWYFCLCRNLLHALGLSDCIFCDFDESKWYASVELVVERGPFKGHDVYYMIPPVELEWLDGNEKWHRARKRRTAKVAAK